MTKRILGGFKISTFWHIELQRQQLLQNCNEGNIKLSKGHHSNILESTLSEDGGILISQIVVLWKKIFQTCFPKHFYVELKTFLGSLIWMKQTINTI